jgi:hypothetical protein
MPKTWCAHYPAFVGRLRDGEIFIVGRRRDQHAALGAAGFYNCVVAWINLVHKLESLAGEHAYLHIEAQNRSQRSQLRLEREYLMEGDYAVHSCTETILQLELLR